MAECGLPYSQIRTGFDIYNIAGGNPLNFTIRTNQVGKYKFEAMAIEDIPAADTIPALLTPSDYRRSDTFTSKPDTQKIVDVINIAPTVTFEVRKKKEVDILIATDYTGQKLADLQAALNVQKASLLAKNIDVRYTIVNSSTPMAHIADSKYWYRRYARYNYIADYEWWSSGGNGDKEYGTSHSQMVVWEEKEALESEAAYLPARMPTNITWYKSGIIFEEDEVGTKNWEKEYFNVAVYAQNDIRNYANIEAETYYRGGMASSTSYGREYTNIKNDNVTIDRAWNKEEKISDVTVNVNSINFASVAAAPLRANSDRYLLLIGDSSSKIYSGAWGTHFPFGGLTKAETDYIRANNIKPYVVTPQATLDTAVGAEKAKEIYAGSLTYFKALDNTLMAILGEYPVSVSLDGEIKEIYGDYILLTNGTLKYRFDGANFSTLASGVTKVIQEKGGSGNIANPGSLWVVTSDGMLRQYKNGAAGYVFNYPDALDVFDGSALMEGNGTYFISTPGATHFIFNNGTAKTLYGAGLVGYLAGDARDDDGDVRDYTAILVHRNGYVQVGIIWRDSSWSHTEDRYVYYLRDIRTAPLYQAVYNESTEKYNYYGYPWVNPVSATSWIIGNKLHNISSGGINYIYSGREYYFLYSPIYDSKAVPDVADVRNGIRYYSDGTIGVPCTWTQRRTGYKGSIYYEQVTSYTDVPALRNKTIKKIVTDTGATAVLTADNQLYKWTDQTAYSSAPAFSFSLASSSASDAFSFSYNTSTSSIRSFTTKSYYIENGDFKDLHTGGIVYEDVTDAAYNNINNQMLVVTEDGKLYGEGYFGQRGYRDMYPVGEAFHELIKTRITIDDTSKQYITLRDLIIDIPAAEYYTAGQYRQALNDITDTYLDDSSYLTNYILVNDEVNYKVTYSDYENDPKLLENWTYNHNQFYFDNSMGLAAFHGQTLASPITGFDRKGQYTINVRAKDNPKADDRFDSYRLWSTGNQSITLYVHEKPIALQRLTITNNGSGTFTVKAFDAGSYDPDHSISRTDEGITAREWRWKEAAEAAWHTGQMNKTGCRPDKRYITQLRVQDVEGVWSEYNTIEIDAGNPPKALFSIEKNPMFETEDLRLKDLSFPQSFSALNRWHWVVKKYNEDGTLPDSNIQDAQYSESNTGSGDMEGCDQNVKTDYSDTGSGRYRIYLRVRDSNGLWSDGGTDGTYNLDKFYSQELAVQESFKISNFRVVKVKDLHLESYYRNPVTGDYEDRPMDVNNMAVDYQNFGGMVDGLTKGYMFEFEMDTVNFNEESDTIEIMPRFYTCDNYSRDPEERDLYWENSRHEILRAGEGGHEAWANIKLTKEDRIIRDGINATWRGSYLIPGTAWAVPAGTSPVQAKANRIGRDIIVGFEIKGYRNEVVKYNYNLQQWPLERTIEKYPYKVGDVIRYSHGKSNLDDNKIIINRP